MSWETYHELKKCLHIDVDVLINHLNHKFSQYWEPSSNITADKSLVPTKAQCLWSVIIKHKPHPKGVKLWSIINKSKFLYTISLFKKVTKKTVTTILHMVGYLPQGQPFTVCADSYFRSVEAAEGLAELSHSFTLSCWKDRPSALFGRFLHSQPISSTSCTTLYHSNPTLPSHTMAAITFQHQKSEGEKVVNFLSNLHAGKVVSSRKKGNSIPDIAHDYNLHMGYVDQLNSACQQFAYPHKLINWKHALFFWLLEATISNTCLIFNHIHHMNEDFRTFRRNLADELRKEGLRLPLLQHGVAPIPNRGKRKCFICRKQGRNSSTTCYCPACKHPLHAKCYPVLHERVLASQGRKRKRPEETPRESDSDVPDLDLDLDLDTMLDLRQLEELTLNDPEERLRTDDDAAEIKELSEMEVSDDYDWLKKEWMET